jgi:hypothetical protein
MSTRRKKRKYVAIDEKGIISVEEELTPELSHGQILVKVHASLISPGTELGSVIKAQKNPGKEKKIPSYFQTCSLTCSLP